MAKKHILVVSQYFYPEQFRINDICTEWVKHGYKVTVLTGIPNYPQGEFYEGYGFIKKRHEEWNGIKIIRIPLIARGQNSIGLLANYMSFVVSGWFWQKITRIKADYVFTFEVSPMTQALIGCWYANKHDIPHYLYVQDLWPENVEIVTGVHNKAVIGNIGKMVNYIYKNCTHIFATSPSFVEEIRKRCDDDYKVSYWPQYAEEFYTPFDKNEAKKNVSEIPDDDSFKVIFTGNIGKAQGLEILPKAAAILAKNDRNVKFVIVGDGRNKDSFLAEVEKEKVSDRFVMVDRQPAERIPALLACADAAFVSFMDNELFTKTIPAKLQSYMACGMPIIASASGETKRVVEEAVCGLCSEIGDAEGLASNIENMTNMTSEELQKMALNACEYSKKCFDKTMLMNEMQEFFE